MIGESCAEEHRIVTLECATKRNSPGRLLHFHLKLIMSRNLVKVCVRTRPTQYFAQDNLFIDTEHSSIIVKHSDPEAEASVLNNRQNQFKFHFDQVFHNSSQTAVYDLYARDIVHDVVYGINGAIMSYGQTGSGKTFTMVSGTKPS